MLLDWLPIVHRSFIVVPVTAGVVGEADEQHQQTVVATFFAVGLWQAVPARLGLSTPSRSLTSSSLVDPVVGFPPLCPEG